MNRKQLSTLIAFFCLLTVGLVVGAENGTELPSASEAQAGFVPGPLPPKAVPLNPEIAHPRAQGGPGEGMSPAEVRFTDVATTIVPKIGGVPQSHIQGELFQVQGTGVAAHTTSWPTEGVDVRTPDVGQGPTKAFGDVGTNFDGLANTGWIPPDTVMAVGSSHVVEAVNSGYAVYTKGGGTLVGYTDYSSFFNSVKPSPWNGFMFDPRVIFSAEHNKYVMLILGLDQSNQNTYFFIAVTQTPDPSGSWWLWRVNADYAGLTPNSWLDYAGLGADTWGIYVTGNYFLWAGGYEYSTIISMNPGMFSGGAANGWQFVNLQWPSTSSAGSPQPAMPLSVAGGGETFFVNSFSGFGSQLLLWTLTGDRTSFPSLSKSAISVASYAGLGENVDQPGSGTDIDGGDSRIMNAVYSQRRVYTTLTNDTNGDGSSSGAYLAKLHVDTNAVEWNTTLSGGSGWYYFYPAVAIGDPAGTSPPVSVFLSYTNPSFNFFASAAARSYGGPPGDVDGPFPALASGLAAYVNLDSNNRNRWGDYTGAGYDFFNGTVWGAVEYAGTANTWRTRVAELSGGGLFSDGFESGNLGAWSSSVP